VNKTVSGNKGIIPPSNCDITISLRFVSTSRTCEPHGNVAKPLKHIFPTTTDSLEKQI
jgi:hypothetical protein